MDLCVEMAERLIPILEDRANDGIIFVSDQYVSGLVHQRNCRIWSTNNPYFTINGTMNCATVNGWYAMSKTQVIRSYFSKDETINQHNYLQLLKNDFYSILKKKRLHKHSARWRAIILFETSSCMVR